MTRRSQVAPGTPSGSSASRRDVLAAATALLASAAASLPARAAVGAEGYFFVFDAEDRMFFIPSAWLELFEVTDVYKARYSTTDWDKALNNMRGMGSGKKRKITALYADSMDTGATQPYPSATVVPALPPAGNQTYIAMMLAPDDIPT